MPCLSDRFPLMMFPRPDGLYVPPSCLVLSACIFSFERLLLSFVLLCRFWGSFHLNSLISFFNLSLSSSSSLCLLSLPTRSIFTSLNHFLLSFFVCRTSFHFVLPPCSWPYSLSVHRTVFFSSSYVQTPFLNEGRLFCYNSILKIKINSIFHLWSQNFHCIFLSYVSDFLQSAFSNVMNNNYFD